MAKNGLFHLAGKESSGGGGGGNFHLPLEFLYACPTNNLSL